jgi:Cys-tRNA(Pro)/Cys-tRNA(Cys) deacylase
MKKEDKTNAMRILDSVNAEYIAHGYETKEALSGVEIAKRLGYDESVVFKTLVTVASSKKNYVFVIPSASELDLKRAAASVGEKSVAMIRQAELLPLTGYIHGGCSPIGMKKLFPTVVHITAAEKERIIFSAGKIGRQVEMNVNELSKAIPFEFADVTRK